MFVTLKRKNLLILAAAGAIAILGAGAFLVFSKPSSPVNPDNAAKINVGITTRSQVIDLLGQPSPVPVYGAFAGPAKAWYGNNDYHLLLAFDENGVVKGKVVGNVIFRGSFLDRLRRWCGL